MRGENDGIHPRALAFPFPLLLLLSASLYSGLPGGTPDYSMIAGVLVRASRHAPAAVSLGIGLGLAASLSSQRQHQGASHADSVATATRKKAEDPARTAAASVGSKGQGFSGDGQGKAGGTKEPSLREDVRECGLSSDLLYRRSISVPGIIR